MKRFFLSIALALLPALALAQPLPSSIGTLPTTIPSASGGPILPSQLPIFTSTLPGAVPASGGLSTNCLFANGIWGACGGGGGPIDPTQIPIFTATVQGVVPASGGGSTNCLISNGTWGSCGTGGGGINNRAPAFNLTLPNTNGTYHFPPTVNWRPVVHQQRPLSCSGGISNGADAPQYHNIVMADCQPFFFADAGGMRDDDATEINYYQLTLCCTATDIVGIDWKHSATAVPRPTNSGFSFMSAVNPEIVKVSAHPTWTAGVVTMPLTSVAHIVTGDAVLVINGYPDAWNSPRGYGTITAGVFTETTHTLGTWDVNQFLVGPGVPAGTHITSIISPGVFQTDQPSLSIADYTGFWGKEQVTVSGPNISYVRSVDPGGTPDGLGGETIIQNSDATLSPLPGDWTVQITGATDDGTGVRLTVTDPNGVVQCSNCAGGTYNNLISFILAEYDARSLNDIFDYWVEPNFAVRYPIQPGNVQVDVLNALAQLIRADPSQGDTWQVSATTPGGLGTITPSMGGAVGIGSVAGNVLTWAPDVGTIRPNIDRIYGVGIPYSVKDANGSSWPVYVGTQIDGTPGGAGHYTLLSSGGAINVTVASEPMQTGLTMWDADLYHTSDHGDGYWTNRGSATGCCGVKPANNRFSFDSPWEPGGGPNVWKSSGSAEAVAWQGGTSFKDNGAIVAWVNYTEGRAPKAGDALWRTSFEGQCWAHSLCDMVDLQLQIGSVDSNGFPVPEFQIQVGAGGVVQPTGADLALNMSTGKSALEGFNAEFRYDQEDVTFLGAKNAKGGSAFYTNAPTPANTTPIVLSFDSLTNNKFTITNDPTIVVTGGGLPGGGACFVAGISGTTVTLGGASCVNSLTIGANTPIGFTRDPDSGEKFGGHHGPSSEGWSVGMIENQGLMNGEISFGVTTKPGGNLISGGTQRVTFAAPEITWIFNSDQTSAVANGAPAPGAPSIDRNGNGIGGNGDSLDWTFASGIFIDRGLGAQVANTIGIGGTITVTQNNYQLAGAQMGVYYINMLSPTLLRVTDPVGNIVGTGTVGVPFANQIGFTIGGSPDTNDQFSFIVGALGKSEQWPIINEQLTQNAGAFNVIGPSGANLLSILANGTTSLAVPLGAGSGGTGINAATAANGSLLIGNGSGFSLAPLTAGENVTITNAAGGITIASTGGNLPVSTQAGTTYTAQSTDCGSMIRFTSGSAVAVTMPNSLAVGCQITLEQAGAGAVTPSAAGGGTLHSAHSFTHTFGQYSVIILTVDTNAGGTAADYIFTGDGA